MTVKITDNHLQRLLRMNPAQIMPAFGEELEAGAQAIIEDAVASILEGAISGAGHIPSKPGEAPNADSGDLHKSIHVGDLVETPGEVRTAAIADSDHAWIERGGSNIEPRPYMEPAAERQRRDIVSALHGRYKREVGL